jgi:hypothetical protein
MSAMRQDILPEAEVSSRRQDILADVEVSAWRQDILTDVEVSAWRQDILNVFGLYYGLPLSKVHKILITRHYRVLHGSLLIFMYSLYKDSLYKQELGIVILWA